MDKTIRTITVFLCILSAISGLAIDLNVGEKTILSISIPNHLKGCQWTTSRPKDVRFTVAPGPFDTKVEIQAINSFPATSPCVIQCKYFFLELDPTTGRYIYQRSDYKRWTIFVSDNRSSEDDDNKPNEPFLKKIGLSTNYLEILEGDEGKIRVRESEAGEYLNWKIGDSSIADIVSKNDGWTLEVKGLKAGSTFATVTSDKGASGKCKISVTKRYFSDGEYVSYKTNEARFGIEVIDARQKTCRLNFIGDDTSEIIYIPAEVYGLKVIEIGDGRIGYKLNCKRIILPESVIRIGESTFSGMTNLTHVDIPNSVKEIGARAFQGCENIENIILPDNLTKIENSTFFDCKHLESIYLPKSISEIGSYAFYNCNNLKNLILPQELKLIRESAFKYCNGIENITIYPELTTIEQGAFQYALIKNVWIIDLSAWCNVRIDNTFSSPLVYAENFYIGNELLRNLIVPEDVITIAEGCFNGYKALESVTLPSSIKEIEPDAFYGCNNVSFVVCKSLIPPICSKYSFDKNISTLYVPAESVEIYKNTAPWMNIFKNILSYKDNSGIKSIFVDNHDSVKYYTLQGIEVKKPTQGLYIKVYGNKSEKVYVP